MNQRTLDNNISPLAGLFIGILAVSSASLLIRFAQREAPSLVIAAYRLGIAAILLAPFCFRTLKLELPRLTVRTILLVLLSGCFLAFHFAFWITSLAFTSVASSVVLVTTAPLWVALFSPLFLNERISKWTVWGMVFSLIGSVVVGMSSACGFQQGKFVCEGLQNMFQGRAIWGNLMALTGAFLSAGYLMTGRKVRGKVSLTSYIFLVYCTAAVVLLLLVLITGEKLSGYSPQIYAWMIALALIPQIIGHSVFNWALKYLSAAYVSIALLGEPVGTVILTMIFLKESPALLELAGGIFILTGIFLATRSEKQAPDLIKNEAQE